jgi:hypothetical protein
VRKWLVDGRHSYVEEYIGIIPIIYWYVIFLLEETNPNEDK